MTFQKRSKAELAQRVARDGQAATGFFDDLIKCPRPA